MTDFARLEVHDGLQVLCRIESITNDEGDSGPALVTRCDPSITVETTLGPWPDDESGWDLADRALASADLANFAKLAVSASGKFTGETQ